VSLSAADLDALRAIVREEISRAGALRGPRRSTRAERDARPEPPPIDEATQRRARALLAGARLGKRRAAR